MIIFSMKCIKFIKFITLKITNLDIKYIKLPNLIRFMVLLLITNRCQGYDILLNNK